MAENKLAELSMDFAVEVLKMCNNLFRHKPILPCENQCLNCNDSVTSLSLTLTFEPSSRIL